MLNNEFESDQNYDRSGSKIKSSVSNDMDKVTRRYERQSMPTNFLAFKTITDKDQSL